MGKLQELNQVDHLQYVDEAQIKNYNGCCREIMEDCEESSMESSSSSMEPSSLDMVEDALSPISNSSLSSSSSNGPLYELSDLMIHLPIKRGLSKYYDGKSESFTSLASVERLEDLGKRGVTPTRKKFKSCKSTFGGSTFDGHKSIVPRATIAKKASRTSRGKTSLICGSRPSAIPVNGH